MIRTSRLTDMNYDGSNRLRMDFTGHATDVIEHAHRIATEVLGDTTWAFVSIEGRLPDNAPLASDMGFKIVAERLL